MTPAEYKALREKLGLTQDELASRLGVTRKTVNLREKGAKITREAQLAIERLEMLYFENAQTMASYGLPSVDGSEARISD